MSSDEARGGAPGSGTGGRLRPQRRIFRSYLLPRWRSLLLVGIAGALAALAAGLQPLVLSPLLQVVLRGAAGPASGWSDLTLNNLGQTLLHSLGCEPRLGLLLVLGTAGAYVLACAVGGLAEFATSLLAARVSWRSLERLQGDMHERMLAQSLPFFARRRTGDLLSRFQADAIETVSCLDITARNGFQSLVEILFYTACLLRTHPTLAFALVAAFLIQSAISRLLAGRLRSESREEAGQVGALLAAAQESILGIRVIKSFAAERFEHGRYAVSVSRLRDILLRGSWTKNVEKPLRMTADAIAIGVVLLFAARALQVGALTAEGFVLFIVVAKRAIGPASSLGTIWTRLVRSTGATERVIEILDAKPDIVDGPRPTAEFARDLRLENVGFAYQPGRPVLAGVTLGIRRGEMVALVGPSGAGKSTLTDLILRLLDPCEGRILIDGIDLREFRQEAYRGLFGVVSQECLLFNATVRENIVFGRAVAPDALERAARIANALDFVERLPQGFNTFVGDRGIRLSGGQRQRIAIARAVYARPPILVLDEATSNLDSEAEREVQQAIDRVLEETTALVVAHRLSTVIRAHRIVVLSEGRIEAVAPHRELLEISPTYRRLYEMQFRPAPYAGEA